MKFALLALLAITSCRSSAVKFMGPDGIQTYELNCSRSLAKCYQKASKICKHGYEVLSQETLQEFYSFNGNLRSDVDRYLTFRCKEQTVGMGN